MKRILLVEDDLSLINGLSFAIKKQGYELDIAHTRSETDDLWQDGKYSLVILDVTLPDGSGFDICKMIRQASKVPIMFLTAMDEETDIIMGLDMGGDDYITKPFKLAVFLSRINALLRRSEYWELMGTDRRDMDVDCFEVRELIGEYGFTLKQLLQLKQEREMMLSQARLYKDEQVQASTDAKYGEGFADFLSEAIISFYEE